MHKRKVAAAVLVVIGAAVIAASGFQVWKIYSQDLQDKRLHDELLSIHENGGRNADGIDQGLAALNAKNSDCIYWFRIPDTDIDYPVMYRPQDQDYYLHRDYNGEYSPSGTLYLSEICDSEHGDNLIIYGHHMRSGTMFAHLEDYKVEDFYKKHKRIELETLQGHEDYEVIAAFTTPVYTGHDFAYYSFASTDDPAEYDRYVGTCKEKSLYPIDKTARYGQRLLTLSTCEYSQKNGRMVVVAVETGKRDELKASMHADTAVSEVEAQEGAIGGGDR